jgi:hypothetical protein
MKSEEWLKDICNTASGPYLRPFAPNRKWREAEVFIVGKCPATPLRDEFESFDAFWESLTRLPDDFYRVYRKKHKGGESNTTGRINLLKGLLHPLSVLVTNATPYPACGRLTAWERQIGQIVFEQLVLTARPRAYLFHGGPALGLANDFFRLDLSWSVTPSVESVRVRNPGARKDSFVFKCVHLSGQRRPAGFTDDDFEDYLRQVADRMKRFVAM